MKTWEEYVMEKLDREKAEAKSSSKNEETPSLGKLIFDMLEQFADALAEDDDSEEETDDAETETTPEEAEDIWQKAIDDNVGDLILYLNIDGVEQDIHLRDVTSFDIALCDGNGHILSDTLLSYDINR